VQHDGTSHSSAVRISDRVIRANPVVCYQPPFLSGCRQPAVRRLVLLVRPVPRRLWYSRSLRIRLRWAYREVELQCHLGSCKLMTAIMSGTDANADQHGQHAPSLQESHEYAELSRSGTRERIAAVERVSSRRRRLLSVGQRSNAHTYFVDLLLPTYSVHIW
jgi:hypothetical protein